MPNTLGNFVVKTVINSLFHPLLGPNLAVITVAERKTGRSISTPINVSREGKAYLVISTRNRTWWRNLRSEAAAQLRVAGMSCTVQGEIVEQPDNVRVRLLRYFHYHPGSARYFKVRLAADGQPAEDDLRHVAAERIIIRLHPLSS